ncbi:MAG: FIST N-terminal domain-containing protein [Candidatus Binatia bacterium]|nr:FIST N-terminal domain-containing protein [Candidatus Binatia bacterium]
MKWCSALSQLPDLVAAIREAASCLRADLGDAEPNLILLFLSEHHGENFREASALVGSEFGSGLVVGCTARSVIGGGQEVEHGPAVSLAAAILPGVTLRPFHYEMGDLPDPESAADVWRKRFGGEDATPHFLILSDPFSFDVEPLICGLDRAFPGGRKVGGVASSGSAPGDNALYVGSDVHREGVVGVALSGAIEVDTVVAQGCRPVGAPMFVTRARENLLYEIDGRSALQVLQELYRSLSPEDQNLARGSLFLGIEMKEAQAEYQQGDFLIRNLLGSEEESGALVVGALLQEPMVVQFHLRDSRTSADDLNLRLQRHVAHAPTGAEGAILFSCLGRGAGLYGEPNHDSDRLREHLGAVPIAGFFCNGEIGPVQGKTFLHGYTSAFALFRPRR